MLKAEKKMIVLANKHDLMRNWICLKRAIVFWGDGSEAEVIFTTEELIDPLGMISITRAEIKLADLIQNGLKGKKLLVLGISPFWGFRGHVREAVQIAEMVIWIDRRFTPFSSITREVKEMGVFVESCPDCGICKFGG